MGLIKQFNELVIPTTVKMMIYGQAGMGKAQPLYASVLTPNGYKRFADIQVGDEVINPDGSTQVVQGVYPQGVRPVYRVLTNDGAETFCDEEHIWSVRASSGSGRKAGFRNRTLKEMLEKGILCSRTPREAKTGRRAMARYEIPVTEPVAHSAKEFAIDPYLLGVLIGDGGLTGNVALFSNPDEDSFIAEKVSNNLPQGYHLDKRTEPNCPQYLIVLNEKESKGNGFINRIKALGLNVHSGNKFIPSDFLLGSVEQRTELLRGLMDTDGWAIRNRVHFSTTSPQLASDVVSLVNSLGGIAKVSAYEREDKSTEYRVNVKTPMCPFSLPRKAAEWSPATISRYIVDATRIEDSETVCIKVSNPNELYITDNYIVTHNTTVALSAPKPLLLDFDNGVKRVNMAHLQSVDIVQVDKWSDIKQLLEQSQEELAPYQTIVVDTIGKMMDFIITFCCGTRQPQIRDWGRINQEFTWFTRALSSLNKHIVFVAHRDTRKEGEETVFIPALREKSYNYIVTELDLLGYLEMKSERGVQTRTITFDPTSRNDGKNTCNLPSVMQVPTILNSQAQPIAPNVFIEDKVIKPYISMLEIKAEERRKYDELIDDITEDVNNITDARSANDFAERIKEYAHIGSSLAKARALFGAKVKELGLVYDSESKKYTDAEPAA